MRALRYRRAGGERRLRLHGTGDVGFGGICKPGVKPTAPQWLESEMSENGRGEVHGDDRFEDGNPRAGRLVQKRGDRTTENRTHTLRSVEKAVVGRCVL